jgi:hypothetical protein
VRGIRTSQCAGVALEIPGELLHRRVLPLGQFEERIGGLDRDLGGAVGPHGLDLGDRLVDHTSNSGARD